MMEIRFLSISSCSWIDVCLEGVLWAVSTGGATSNAGGIPRACPARSRPCRANSRINPGVVYKAHNRKSASLKDDFIKSAMGAMDRTLSSFNEESLEGKIENEVEAGFRRRGTGQNISAKSFSSLECLVFIDLRDQATDYWLCFEMQWEGSALPEASLLFYRATPTYLSDSDMEIEKKVPLMLQQAVGMMADPKEVNLLNGTSRYRSIMGMNDGLGSLEGLLR
ncbi:hypothetical protein Tco_0986191 [Tanacetum coccineum]